MADDEAGLVARMRAGDSEAMRTLVGRYHRPLFAFVYRLTDDYSLADDIAQETFIRLARQAGLPPQNVRAWTFAVARNLVYDYFRSAAYRRERELDDRPALGAAPEDEAIAADQRTAIAAQLQRLPPEQREVVVLRYYHDMPLQEIAALTHAPLGTVKSRLFLALKRLKDRLTVKGYSYE